MMKRRGFLTAVALAVLAGCSDGPGVTSGALVAEVDTRWALQSVDGHTLPTRQQVTFEAAADVTAARLTVSADGAWVYRYDQVTAEGGQESLSSGGAAGTFEPMSADPPTIRMLDGETQETFVGAYKQGALEVTMRGQVLRFARIP